MGLIHINNRILLCCEKWKVHNGPRARSDDGQETETELRGWESQLYWFPAISPYPMMQTKLRSDGCIYAQSLRYIHHLTRSVGLLEVERWDRSSNEPAFSWDQPGILGGFQRKKARKWKSKGPRILATPRYLYSYSLRVHLGCSIYGFAVGAEPRPHRRSRSVGAPIKEIELLYGIT